MKTTIRILIFFLALSLCGCKTKEKMTERLTETAQSNSCSTVMTSQHTEQQGQTSMTEETTQTSWSDSVVEKTRERIVTDSSGRVLLHEAERTTEHYKGRGKSLTHQQQNRQEKSEVTSQGTVTETNDSTYNGGSINEVTVVKKKSWRWLWYVGILASLLIVGYIISKVIRR